MRCRPSRADGSSVLRRVAFHRDLDNAKRLLDRDEEIFRVVDAGAEEISGTIRTLVEGQRHIGDLLIRREHDVGDRIQRVMHGSARMPCERLDDGCAHALTIGAERDVWTAVGPSSGQPADEQTLQSIVSPVIDRIGIAGSEARRAHHIQIVEAGNHGDLASIARHRGGLHFGGSGNEYLTLHATARIEARPGALGDLDPYSRDGGIVLENTIADRKPELFDLAGAMVARGTVDEILQRLSGW